MKALRTAEAVLRRVTGVSQMPEGGDEFSTTKQGFNKG